MSIISHRSIFILLLIFMSIGHCFGQDYFPLQIGNRWVYLHLERPVFDVIEIIDTTRINDNLYYCYREKQLWCNWEFYGYWRKDSFDRVWYAKEETSEEFLTNIRFNIAPGIIGTEYDSLNGFTYIYALLDTGWVQSTPTGIYDHCYYFNTYIEECEFKFQMRQFWKTYRLEIYTPKFFWV